MAKKVVRHTRLVALASLAVAFLFSMNALIVPVEARQADMWMSSNSDWSQSLLPVATLTVTAPTATKTIPTNFVVPIVVGDTTGQNITAFQFNILYNPAYIHPLNDGNFGCDTTGTISNTGVGGQANLSATCNVSPDGTLHVAAAGSKPMTGAGTVVNITFTIDPAAGGGNISPLSFEALSVFFFGNFGVTPVPNTPVDGQITLHDTSTTTISCAPGTFVYTASPITPCIATVTGSGGLNTTTPVTYTNNTNVGTATANATYGGDAGHDGSTAAPVNFAITPANGNALLTCGVTGYNVVYDASPHTATAPANCTSSLGGTVTGTFDLSGTVRTNVSSGNDPWTFTSANYTPKNGTVADAITPANGNTSLSCAVTGYNVVYDALPHTATAPASCTSSLGGTVTGTFDLSGTVHTNVFSGNDTWTFTSANYSLKSGTVADAITPANGNTLLTCAVTGYNVVYDALSHTATAPANCTSSLGGTVTGTFDLSGTVHTNVFSGNDPWTFTSANYSLKSGTVADAITPANGNTSLTCNVTGYNVVYNLLPHTATAPGSCTSSLGGTVTGTFDLSGTTHTGAGSYPIDPWTFTSANYSLKSGTVADTITKRVLNIDEIAITKVFGTADPTETPTLSGFLAGDNAGNIGLTGSASCTRAPGENVGTYLITCSQGTLVAANYTFQLGATASLTITIATSATVISCPASVAYTGVALTPCTAAVTGAGGLNTTATVVYGNNINVGTATANASYAGDANHSSSTATQATFAITLATSTTVITCPAAAAYTGAPVTPCTAAVTGAGLNTTATVVYGNNTNPGTATANASYAGDANHSPSTAAQKTFQIVQNAQADLSITKTDGVTNLPAGAPTTYIITVSNGGPNTATGATVTDTFPSAITNATWTCVGAGGGTCGASAGTGNINETVNLPVGGTVTYTVTANTDPRATGTLTNTATVTPPLNLPDPVTANNVAKDVDNLTAAAVFVVDDVQHLEGDSGTTPYVFTVTKTGPTGYPTSCQLETRDGSATVADNDYQFTTGTLNFGPLETSKTFTVLVNGDTKIEPDELFSVHILDNPVNALAFDGNGTGKIINDDPTAPTPTPTPTPVVRFEGDINRTAVGVPGTGDGDVTVGDQIQFLRFASGVDCPSVSPNEQQRLDAGPRVTFGDGLIGAADGTAIDAYARHDASTDFNPNVAGWQPTPAAGPTNITNLGCAPGSAPEGDAAAMAVPEADSAAAARIVRLLPRSGRAGSDITVDIEMAAQGNEAGTQFGLHFDPAVLSISDISGGNANPDIAVGAGLPDGTTLNVNAEDAANGNIGIVENFNGGAATITAIPEGATRIARVRFHVLDRAAGGSSSITFDDSVIRGFTSDVNGFGLSASYDQSGAVTVIATPGVRVSGAVTTPDGRGLRNATVTITDQSGISRTVTTSAFGFYTFESLTAGERYTIGVASRQFRFASRTIEVTDNLADVNFTGLD